jgi:hypothetical protein
MGVADDRRSLEFAYLYYHILRLIPGVDAIVEHCGHLGPWGLLGFDVTDFFPRLLDPVTGMATSPHTSISPADTVPLQNRRGKIRRRRVAR